jgi:hypothetical protein
LYGVASVSRTAKQGCWPERQGRIVVRFTGPSSPDAWELRIGYLWYAKVPWVIRVHYGGTVQNLYVRPGLHSGYLPVAGSVRRIVIDDLGGYPVCVGDAEIGTFVQSQVGPVIPPVSH